MRDEIRKFAMEMERIMQKHDKVKGDSWKSMELGSLELLLAKEHNEYWAELANEGNEKAELVDIANVCMMIYNHPANDAPKEGE